MTVEPYDHLRVAEESATGEEPTDGAVARDDTDVPATDGTLAPGVYRVVGVDDGRATLLRVTDADGRRVRSRRVERVERATVESLGAAGDPDANPGPLRLLASMADGLVWTLRGGLGRLVP